LDRRKRGRGPGHRSHPISPPLGAPFSFIAGGASVGSSHRLVWQHGRPRPHGIDGRQYTGSWVDGSQLSPSGPVDLLREGGGTRRCWVSSRLFGDWLTPWLTASDRGSGGAAGGRDPRWLCSARSNVTPRPPAGKRRRHGMVGRRESPVSQGNGRECRWPRTLGNLDACAGCDLRRATEEGSTTTSPEFWAMGTLPPPSHSGGVAREAADGGASVGGGAAVAYGAGRRASGPHRGPPSSPEGGGVD